MGKTEIKVSCNDQVLKITESPVLAAGGLNEVRIAFNFCEKWAGFVKTAIFYRNEEDVFYAVLDENDTCIVPWEVCYEEGTFYFGVFGEKGSIRRTTNIVRYKVKKGAITTDMQPSDPTPDVYDQIIAEIASIRAENKAFVEEVNNTLEKAVKPVKGVDYWTESDKEELVNDLTEQTAPISYKAQTLDDDQKAQARDNINAASAADFDDLSLRVGELENGGGASAEYRHIYTYEHTADEGVKEIHITADKDGNAFACSDFLMYLTLPTNAEIANWKTQLHIGHKMWEWDLYIGQGFSMTKTRRMRIHMYHAFDGYWVSDGAYNDKNESTYEAIISTDGYATGFGNLKSMIATGKTISELHFLAQVTFDKGTKIEIYGK